MKTIFTLFIASLLSVTASARTLNTCISWWGDWSNKSSWSLNRAPRSGDSVVIPAGYGVVMELSNASYSDLYINVQGTLEIKKGLALGSTSYILVGQNGLIRRFGAKPNEEVITINGVKKYDEVSPYNIRGIMFANASTGVSPVGFSSNFLLPLQFLNFSVAHSDEGNTIVWSTAEEVDGEHYEIEKSLDGVEWTTIAILFAEAKGGMINNYKFLDKNETRPQVYYRIAQVDAGTPVKYSNVRMIKMEMPNKHLKIFKSSASTIAIDWFEDAGVNLDVTVVGMNGQQVAQKKINSASNRTQIELPLNNAGVLVVKVREASGCVHLQKIVF